MTVQVREMREGDAERVAGPGGRLNYPTTPQAVPENFRDLAGWSADPGLSRRRFCSRMRREETHRFYESLGYRVIKESHFSSKDLARG